MPQPVQHACGRAGGVTLEAECQVVFILPMPASPSGAGAGPSGAGAGQTRLMVLTACHCLCRVLLLAFCTTQSPWCCLGRISSCPERLASFAVEFRFLFPWHRLFVADELPRSCTNLKAKRLFLSRCIFFARCHCCQGNSDPAQMCPLGTAPQAGAVLRCLGTSRLEQPASSLLTYLLTPVAAGEGDLEASGPAPGDGSPWAPLQLCQQQVD